MSDSGKRCTIRQQRALLSVLLAALLVLAGCETPGAAQTPSRHAYIATQTSSPLASQTVYWSQDFTLLALRASDGYVRWQIGGWTSPVPGCTSCTYSLGPGVPTLADGTLYTLTTNDHASSAVYAYSASDGTTRWQTPIAGCLAFPGSPPLVANGVLYVALTNHRSSNLLCGSSSWVYALRASDGHVLWRVPFAPSAFSTLALTDGVIVVSNSTYPADPEVFSLTGLRASDGKQLWRMSRANRLGSFAASGGVVFVTGQPGIRFDSGLIVEAFRASDGARLWEKVLARSGDGGSASFLGNGMIYIFGSSDDLYALRASDGQVAWHIWHITIGARWIGAPTVANGRIYVGIGPNLKVFDASSGSLVHAFSLFDQSVMPKDTSYSWSAPVVTSGMIFISAGADTCEHEFPVYMPECQNGKLYAVDSTTGQIRWQYQSQHGYGVSAPALGS